MSRKKGNREFPKVAESIKEEIVIPEVETVEEPKEETIKEVDAIVDGVDMYLNIRKKPEVKDDNKITMLKKGYRIVVVDPEKPIQNKGESWFKIKIGNPPQEGYAMKKYIKII